MKAFDVTNSICEKVTNKLIAMIEAGVTPWQRPWEAGTTADNAISHTTGSAYSLLNQILLCFRPGEYLTFNQVKAEGGRVKKGAKSSIIVFWCRGYSKKGTTTDDEGREVEGTVFVQYARPILKAYNVFHIDDCEGIKPKHSRKTEVKRYDFERDTAAEDVAADYLDRSGVTLNVVDSDRAFYRPSDDSVTVPLREQFSHPSKFYATLYHELGHSTGHKSRFDRFAEVGKTAARGEEYSREELVAEICSATCLSELGINTEFTDNNSADYLKGWSSLLKDDPMAFIVAAGKAEKAFKMIFNR